MVLQDYRHREIQSVLQVSSGFISKWTGAFEQQGVEGLRLQHKGSTGYLDAQERLAVLEWLKHKNYWDLQELQADLENSYDVVFSSLQSYYGLFHTAGISWNSTQKRNPKKDLELVEKKTGNHHVVRSTSSSN